ncbi:hypothetical protein PG994_015236 [Apiospora phragmitis]|uniref:Zn(2)-C6 fungal-type domain-containing protein n=1 Tax=Apiospora phragmitis TaxID=2905665 RepID=A0ABR1SSP2_9PEZI
MLEPTNSYTQILCQAPNDKVRCGRCQTKKRVCAPVPDENRNLDEAMDLAGAFRSENPSGLININRRRARCEKIKAEHDLQHLDEPDTHPFRTPRKRPIVGSTSSGLTAGAGAIILDSPPPQNSTGRRPARGAAFPVDSPAAPVGQSSLALFGTPTSSETRSSEALREYSAMMRESVELQRQALQLAQSNNDILSRAVNAIEANNDIQTRALDLAKDNLSVSRDNHTATIDVRTEVQAIFHLLPNLLAYSADEAA